MEAVVPLFLSVIPFLYYLDLLLGSTLALAHAKLGIISAYFTSVLGFCVIQACNL